MIQGKIIKAISGFHYVHTGDKGVYACRAKGIFRKNGIRPLVGDDVVIDITHEKDKEGNITDILKRKNELIRPAAANVDQAVVIFSLSRPKASFYLLDRFLVSMEAGGIPSVICFNKLDEADSAGINEIKSLYEPSGYPLIFTGAKTGEGVDELEKFLCQKTSIVAGPSGVGKSTLINRLCPDAGMETGAISEKIKRGRHTTRHTELFPTGKAGGYIMDTPGFTSLYLKDIKKGELWKFFPEFLPYAGECRFADCSHIHEPGCGIKKALSEGRFHAFRYEHYKDMYTELRKD